MGVHEEYSIIKAVGGGTFGVVYQATSKLNGEMVAIKRIPSIYKSSYDTEVKPLKKFNDHPNIIKMIKSMEDDMGDNLILILEYIHTDLDRIIDENTIDEEEETQTQTQVVKYGETEIKKWCFQLLSGLDYIHKGGYFHRDLKPSNLLVSENRENLKICDFRCAREIDDQTPCSDYVTTRWYQAPEVLLGSQDYGPAIDIWAVGTILAELYMGEPIFPGTSKEDQIQKISNVVGSDINDSYNNISSLIPSATIYAISLINSLCSWDPIKRPTAEQALQHPFFHHL